ncbi:uncharacterized protein LOC17891538 isoform X3 [Capsella rubella]|uniref:uncharacterized protein LOC17891538 isoform X3 n=1 Tax=Capsella rubella TaxID=81985 RepID=UPI000CD537A1|nr:uncharacterized protein LOC17891538 isoform X3 [Capsella rubella]
MVEQSSEDANHIAKLWEFEQSLRESTDKSQCVREYEGIINFSKRSIETMELGAELITKYFHFFHTHSKQAFKAYKAIIEKVGPKIRVQAIKKLPLFCKFTPELVSDIIGVLVWCLDTDQQEQLDAVHETFLTLFQHNTLHNLIEKSLGKVRGDEIKMVTNFLTSLSKFGLKAPQERIPELVEIVERQVDLDAKFNIQDADFVERLIPYLQSALPFSVRCGTDTKFLNFLKKHIMPDFDKLPGSMKLDLLKALAESSPHTTFLDAVQMLPSIVQLLKKYMPAKMTVEKLDSIYVECLLYMFHHMAHKVPYATNSLCGYKFVTRIPSDRIGDDLPKLYKEFTERLTDLEELIKASMEKLIQEMSDNDKANLASNPMNGDEEADLYTNRQDIKTKIRSCINILAMTEVLHAETPSLIGDTRVVKLSWKEATKPLTYAGPVFYRGSTSNENLPVPPNMEAFENLMEHLPEHVLFGLDKTGICFLEDFHVEELVGLSGLRLAKDTSPVTKFTLYDDHELACILWKINKKKLLKFLTTKSWKVILGYIRNQFLHLICWAYASSDLVSATMIMRNWEERYIPLCAWYLCAFCRPEYLDRDEQAAEGHDCYGNSMKDCLLYIKEKGIPLEICKEFDCQDYEPPNADEPQMHKRRIKSIRTIDSLEEALLLLPKYPIGADLVTFEDELWKPGDQIYSGPGPKSYGCCSYHGVIIAEIEECDEDVVAICKMSNGTEVADKGYVRVSLTTVYMVAGVCPEESPNVRATPKPMHLLSNFIIIDMDENGKGKEKEREREKETENPEENQEQNSEEKPKENQEQTPEEKQEEHKQYPDLNASRNKFHNFLRKHIMPDSDKVQVQAICKLPLFCKDTPEFVSEIVDVLVQCLDTDQQEQLDAVHGAFMSLFQQDTKAASLTALFKHTEANLTTDQICVKVLHYIRDKVLPLKGELLNPQEEIERHITDLIKKTLGHVSGEEIKMFMAFLTSLSIFGVKTPQERMQELVGIVEGLANLDAKLNVSDAYCLDRLILYLQVALPFIVRGGSDSKFLNFLKRHIMPIFDKLPEPMKLDLLKALAESSPHKTALVLHGEAPSFISDTSVVTKPSASTITLGKRPADGAGNDVDAKKARTESSSCDQRI